MEFLLGSTARLGEIIVLGMLTQMKEVRRPAPSGPEMPPALPRQNCFNQRAPLPTQLHRTREIIVVLMLTQTDEVETACPSSPCSTPPFPPNLAWPCCAVFHSIQS